MNDKKKKFIIIDSNSILHRAFHALPPLSLKTGEVVNAVYGFLLVFLRAVKTFEPDFIAAVFDFPAPTFRHRKYKEYKGKRPPTPKDLSSQIPKIKEVLAAFNVPVFEKKGYEADDIIGTISRIASQGEGREAVEMIILSGDLDLLQLISPQVKVYALRKGVKDVVLYDKESTKEKFQGLGPEQLLEFKSLRGDASDNIPGVAGIGEKTAAVLVSRFGDLENLYRNIEEEKEGADGLSSRMRELLIKNKKDAFLSRDLAKIDRNVPLEFSLDVCGWKHYSRTKAGQALEELEFYSLLGKLPDDHPIGENLKLW